MVRAAGARQGHRPAASPNAAEEKPKIASTVKRMLGMDDAAILVRGHDDLMVYRSKCCNPIPGDDIIGYVTRGRGIAVHGKNCPNVENLLYEAERRIPVEWAGTTACHVSRCACASSPKIAPACSPESPASSAKPAPISALLRAAAQRHCARASKWRWTFATASNSNTFSRGIKRIPGVFDIERVYNV